MGIPVELWRTRIGSFQCSRGATPKGHYNGVFVDRLARARDRPAALYSRQSKDQLVACSRSNTYDCPAAILLLKVVINGSYVLLLASRSLLARILKMAAMIESLKLSSSTASFLYSADGGVMSVVLVTASLTGEGVTPDTIIQLLSIIQLRGNWYQAGTSSKHYGMPALASHSLIMMAYDVLVCTTSYVIMMCIHYQQVTSSSSQWSSVR